MATHVKRQEKSGDGCALLHWGRFIMAILALLIAAAHLPFASASLGGPMPHLAPANATRLNQTYHAPTTSAPSSFGPQAMSMWFGIEVVAYTIVAVVFLLGLRSWYVPAVIFNAFNMALYFLSGVVAIPGITSIAFGMRSLVSPSLSMTVLVLSWICALVIGMALLKYDRGSDLDKLLGAKWK